MAFSTYAGSKRGQYIQGGRVKFARTIPINTPTAPRLRSTITHEQLRDFITDGLKTHQSGVQFSDNIFKDILYNTFFWSVLKDDDVCTNLQLFQSEFGFAIKTTTEIKNNTELAVYSGIVVPIAAGWNSLGVDRKMVVLPPSPTNPRTDTWHFNNKIFGADFKLNSQQIYIDGYINGNWTQFINCGTTANCKMVNGKITTTKTIKAGTELLLSYGMNAATTTRMSEIQAGIIKQVHAPSIDNLHTSIWLYPGNTDRKHKNSKIELKIKGAKSENAKVISAEENKDIKETFVPHIRNDTLGPYINITCEGQHTPLKWNRCSASTTFDTFIVHSTTSKYMDKTQN